MATQGRRSPAPVMERLRARPADFGFFQAVRLLEAEAALRQRRPVGEDFAPASECVRFRAAPTLSFPDSEVRDLRAPEDGEGAQPPEMEVAFFGLIGALGTLPKHYDELVLDRLRLRDTTLRDYLDLFHHRALSFFYRAWRKYRLPFEFEAAHLTGGRDAFTRAFLCLSGFGLQALPEDSVLDEHSIAFYSGHLSHRPRSAAGLEGLLRECFGFGVRLESFVGQWLEIPADERSGLSGSCTAGLGQGFVLGSRFWNVSSKVRVHVGPLSLAQYRLVVPGSPGHARLGDLTRLYLGPGIDFDLVAELTPGSAPPLRLGGASEDAPRLGWSSWVTSNVGAARVEPAVFRMEC